MINLLKPWLKLLPELNSNNTKLQIDCPYYGARRKVFGKQNGFSSRAASSTAS